MSGDEFQPIQHGKQFWTIGGEFQRFTLDDPHFWISRPGILKGQLVWNSRAAMCLQHMRDLLSIQGEVEATYRRNIGAIRPLHLTIRVGDYDDGNLAIP